ncbi:tetratricopeptide repeat-containing sensor histidine kinase [Moheibacter sediminis]|uniref:Oxygen sensor histidine kinase NreB n=1 Tax=Moheibacter sediminis TaxID=1434700 RepID=A0A1W1YA99_9FLAO|nr:sensor histidine kinase [Moheibacter sediminis]SMC33092.1 Signal transduction histidine kinase [Moheibacter sediminis]
MRVYLFFLVLFTAIFSYSQDVESQIEKNYQEYRRLVDANPDSALIYLSESKKLNEKNNDLDWSARIYYGIGYSYFVKQKYIVALENFNQAVGFAKQSSNSNILSKSYNQIGLIYSFQNDYKKALNYFHSSLNISENREELSDNTMSVLSNIADLYILQQDTISALRYYHQAVKIGEREDKKAILAGVLNNIAVSYMDNNKDSTEFYLKKALQIYKETNNSYGQIMTQNNLATTYMNFTSVEDYPQSLRYLNESLRLSQATKNIDAEFFTYYYLGNYFEEAERDNVNAKNYYEKAFDMLKRGYKNDYTIELYKSLSRVYLKLGDYKNAYEFQKIQHELQDSIFSVQKNKQFHETQTKFDVERKNTQIQLLNKETQIEKGHKRLILIGSILLIIPLLLLAVFYRTRMRYQQTISEQDKLLFEKEKETIKAKNLIEGQNMERSRIAKELHDGVGGRLSAIKIKMDQLNTTTIQDSELDYCIKQLQDTAREIRVISHELNENKINELNFVHLVTHLIDDYKFYFNGEIHFNIFPEDKYEKITGVNKHYLYRVIQEILSNCLKYAEAENIYVDCTFDEVYRIIIDDDGKGFDVANVKKGMGMDNIRKRVETLQGKLHVDSQIGRGATFIMEIPENGTE